MIKHHLYDPGFLTRDHTKHSGGLCLRGKSHRHQSVHKGKIINVRSEVGDVVVWKLTTTHSGNVNLFNLLPSWSLHPNISRRLPGALRLKPIQPRMALFCSFGKDDDYLKGYIEFLESRTYAVNRGLATSYDAHQAEDMTKLGVKVVELDKNKLEELKQSNQLSDTFKQL